VVSGAAGSVGSIVGQIARIKGCRAVGIAGRVSHGDIAQFPDVLLRLFHGENTGKLVPALDGE
jgi:NADPH-dependent curcumin reductase CurA